MTARLDFSGSALSNRFNSNSMFVEQLQSSFPDIELYTPQTNGYSEVRLTRCLENTNVDPLVIAVPKNSTEVAALVSTANSLGVKIAIRSGGNEFYGRNMFSGALIIDMREIDYLEVASDSKTAKVGGGIVMNRLIPELDAHGLVTPFGNAGIVGYVGWATLGGYGPLTAAFGMGYDQIVAAELVNHQGQIVDANKEMLQGIRGMGGNLGVVVSLTIKVYPTRNLYSGMLIYESTNLAETIRNCEAGINSLTPPPSLNFHHFVLQNPAFGGRAFAVIYTDANEDENAAKSFLDEFLKVTPPVSMNTVASISPLEAQKRVPTPCAAWGAQRSVFVRAMTPKILDTLLDALSDMPIDPGVNMGWGPVRANNPSVVRDPKRVGKATFGAQHAHCLITFSYTVMNKENLEMAKKWNKSLHDAILASGDDAVTECAYIPLSPPGDRKPSQLYGDCWERVMELKTKFDPNGVFSLAVPHLTE